MAGPMAQEELGHLWSNAACLPPAVPLTLPTKALPSLLPTASASPTAGTTAAGEPAAVATSPVAAATGAQPAEAAAARLVETGARPGRIGEGAAVEGGAKGAAHEAAAAPATPAATTMLPPASIVTTAPASPTSTTAATVPAGALNKASCWVGGVTDLLQAWWQGRGQCCRRSWGMLHSFRMECAKSAFHLSAQGALLRPGIDPAARLPPLLFILQAPPPLLRLWQQPPGPTPLRRLPLDWLRRAPAPVALERGRRWWAVPRAPRARRRLHWVRLAGCLRQHLNSITRCPDWGFQDCLLWSLHAAGPALIASPHPALQPAATPVCRSASPPLRMQSACHRSPNLPFSSTHTGALTPRAALCTPCLQAPALPQARRVGATPKPARPHPLFSSTHTNALCTPITAGAPPSPKQGERVKVDRLGGPAAVARAPGGIPAVG